jgi:hypothetical protein
VVIDVCPTSGSGSVSGCPSITGITADDGSLSVESGCSGISILGCDGIETRVEDGNLLICYTGSGITGSGCCPPTGAGACSGAINSINGTGFNGCVDLSIGGSFCGNSDFITVDGTSIDITITEEDITGCIDITGAFDSCCIQYTDHEGAYRSLEVLVPECVTDCYGCCD